MSIIVDHVSYKYNNELDEGYAIKDINLKIEDGEFVGIIGHTGSGKSTLVQHLNGLEKATDGKLYFQGEDVYDSSYPIQNLRKEVGLVFQYPEYQLFESTVFKDIAYGPHNLGLPKLEVDLRSYQAMKDVGLSEELLDVSPFSLSGGQKRKVAIAGVLAMEPKVLILDEPTAGLDPKGRKEILQLIQRIHKERKCTVIIVSHSMEDMANYAERLIVMHKGQVVLDGNTRDVFSHEEELTMLGLAIPQVTQLQNRLEKRGIKFSKNVITVEEMKEELTRLLKR